MEAIDADLRGIAILYLADRFKKLYIKWRCAWIQHLANHKSELLLKKFLSNYDNISDDVAKNIRESIKEKQRAGSAFYQQIESIYREIVSLENKIKELLDCEWDWRIREDAEFEKWWDSHKESNSR